MGRDVFDAPGSFVGSCIESMWVVLLIDNWGGILYIHQSGECLFSTSGGAEGWYRSFECVKGHIAGRNGCNPNDSIA